MGDIPSLVPNFGDDEVVGVVQLVFGEDGGLVGAWCEVCFARAVLLCAVTAGAEPLAANP